MAKGDIEAKERIWLDADRTEALPEGHEDAHVLLAGEGGMISKEDAEKYGIGEDGKISGGAKPSKKSKKDAKASIDERSTRVASADSKK